MVSDKGQLREHYKALRMSAYTAKMRSSWEEAIAERLFQMPQYQRCGEILVYVSGNIEVSTNKIISNALESGKSVFCPRCVKDTNIMHFYRINSFDDLEKGSFGILEPRESCLRVTDFPETALCIVPGLSYDILGYRLGFGKGFYDRFLADFKGVKIGLCFENCITDKLPSDEFDIRADIVVTEERIVGSKA